MVLRKNGGVVLSTWTCSYERTFLPAGEGLSKHVDRSSMPTAFRVLRRNAFEDVSVGSAFTTLGLQAVGRISPAESSGEQHINWIVNVVWRR